MKDNAQMKMVTNAGPKLIGTSDGLSVKSCPDCGKRGGSVDSRPGADGWRRRYRCECGARWSTVEIRAEASCAGGPNNTLVALVNKEETARARAKVVAEMRAALDRIANDEQFK